MEAGRLQHRISIQALTETQDADTGVITATWATTATVWANVRFLSGREFIAADRERNDVTATIVIYFRDGLEPKMRIRFGARIFNIIEILPDPAREFLTMPVREIRE